MILKIKSNKLLYVFLSLLLAASIMALSSKGVLKRIEMFGIDTLFRLRLPISFNSKVVIIEISDEEIAEVGWWPWRRSWHAALVSALKEMGAKYVFFDVLFPEHSFEEDDNLFAAAIARADNVYLPFAFKRASTELKEAVIPIEKFSSVAKGTGSVNIYPDIDGVIRHIPLFFKGKEGMNYHICLRLAMDYLGLGIKEIKSNRLILSAPQKGEIVIPLVDGNKMLINWLGKWKETFNHYSYLDVLSAYQDITQNKKPEIDVSKLKDSICLIAVTAIGFQDIKTFPLESEYFGVGVTATAISNIMDKKFVKMSSFLMDYFFVYILCLLSVLWVSRKSFFKVILPFIILIGLTVYFLLKTGWILNIYLYLFAFSVSYLIGATVRYITISIERKRLVKLALTDELTSLYNIRYFKLVLKGECSDADVVAKNFCVILGDVDHFKLFNDTYGHQMGDMVLKEVAMVLRTSIRPSDVVARYGGEEIIILLKGANLKNGLIVAEKLRRNVEEHTVRYGDNNCKVTISLGITCFIHNQDNENTIIKRADDALYRAKEIGRNRVCSK